MVALAVRIAAIEATGAGSVRFGDGADYIATARSVCSEQVYPERGNLPFFRPPGLPFLIAGATLCETSQVRVIKYALAACDAATAVVIFELALLLWGFPMERLGFSPVSAPRSIPSSSSRRPTCAASRCSCSC